MLPRPSHHNIASEEDVLDRHIQVVHTSPNLYFYQIAYGPLNIPVRCTLSSSLGMEKKGQREGSCLVSEIKGPGLQLKSCNSIRCRCTCCSAMHSYCSSHTVVKFKKQFSHVLEVAIGEWRELVSGPLNMSATAIQTLHTATHTFTFTFTFTHHAVTAVRTMRDWRHTVRSQ